MQRDFRPQHSAASSSALPMKILRAARTSSLADAVTAFDPSAKRMHPSQGRDEISVRELRSRTDFSFLLLSRSAAWARRRAKCVTALITVESAVESAANGPARARGSPILANAPPSRSLWFGHPPRWPTSSGHPMLTQRGSVRIAGASTALARRLSRRHRRDQRLWLRSAAAEFGTAVQSRTASSRLARVGHAASLAQGRLSCLRQGLRHARARRCSAKDRRRRHPPARPIL